MENEWELKYNTFKGCNNLNNVVFSGIFIMLNSIKHRYWALIKSTYDTRWQPSNGWYQIGLTNLEPNFKREKRKN